LNSTAIFRTDWSLLPSSATALTNGQPRKSFAEKRRSSQIEGAENLLDRRLVGSARGHERRQIGRDQRVLGRKMIVERSLADADFGRDGVDADRTNPLQIEQPVCSFQNPVLHRRFGGQGSHANAWVTVCLTANAPYSLVTQVCVPISNINCRTRLSNRGR
jgi:hypothetical protein